MLVAVFGLPGSGKSYFASRLADRIGAAYLGSDALRRKLVQDPGYAPEEKERVYADLIARASSGLRAGRTVVLDATFHTAARRRKVARLATASGVPVRWIEVFAADPVVRRRLAGERQDSDADYAVHEKIRREFEPMQEPHLRIESTQANVAQMLERALAYVRA